MIMKRIFLFPLFILAAGFFLSACGDKITGPGTVKQPPIRLVSSFTEWFASEPRDKQRGEFEYDDQDRLVLYRFWVTRETGWENTIYITYEYEEDRLTTQRQFTWLDGGWRLTRNVAYAYDGGNIATATVDWINERTATQHQSVYRYIFNKNGQITSTSIRGASGDGDIGMDETHEYFYDDLGNVVRTLSTSSIGPPRESRYTHHDSWNPFARILPPESGVNLMGVPDRYSYRNSITWENRVPGEEPAMVASATVETEPSGFPVRKEFSIDNTGTPGIDVIFVTEITYRE